MIENQIIDIQTKSETEIYWTIDSEVPKKGDIYDNYLIEDLIIETNCSFLMAGKDIRDNTEKAIKFIKLKKKNKDRCHNEVNIMKILDHPNILKLEYSLEQIPYIVAVTKFAPYQNLALYTKDNYPQGMPENLAKNVMRQMLESVNYLHKRNIRHRDIKPHNFLVFEREPQIKVVLSDFGFAREYIFNEKGEEYIGTELFAPPEIHLHHPYTNSVDIWPLGVSLFILLTNRAPFRGCNERYTLINKITRGMLNYRLLRNKNISSKAIDMIKKMCKVNPEERLTAEQLLEHPWITNDEMNVSIEKEDSTKSN